MGMGLGMIGMMGGFDSRQGVGGALQEEGAQIGKRDDEQRQLAQKKDYQQWLLSTQQQYELATNDELWNREKARAPEKAQIAADADTTKAGATLDFKEKNSGRINNLAQAETNAKKTPEEREDTKQRGRYYGALADDVAANGRGGKGGADNAGTKLEPDDELELKSLNARLAEKEKLIDAQRAQQGAWDPEKNPSQKQMLTEKAALELRQSSILSKYRTGAADTPGKRTKNTSQRGGLNLFGEEGDDPGMSGIPVKVDRVVQQGTPQATPGKVVRADVDYGNGQYGMMASKRSAEPLPREDATISPESGDISQRDINNIKDPQARADLRKAMTDRKAPMNPKPAAADAPVVAPPGSGSPTPMSPPVDRANPLMVVRDTQARGARERALADEQDSISRPTRDEYLEERDLERQRRQADIDNLPTKPFEEKLKSLRAKIAERQQRQLTELAARRTH